MTSRVEHFPPGVESLPDLGGPFDAHRLTADGCDVLFATYPAGADHSAAFDTDSAEIEFWFEDRE